MKEVEILVVDCGSRFVENIVKCCEQRNASAKKIAWQNLDSEIELNRKSLKGIIISGSPWGVYREGAPTINKNVLEGNIPVLGICYGAQLIAYILGKKVTDAECAEQTLTPITLLESKLFEGIESQNFVEMRHVDRVYEVPDGYKITSYTKDCPIASYENDKGIYAVQFHPEIGGCGDKILDNFIYKICKI